MYNTDLPRRVDLPTSAQLRKSTAIAFISASVLLATVVLPSEYGLDPTGIGSILGLKQMGEIKQQLAAENAKEASAGNASLTDPAILARLDRIEAKLDAVSKLTSTREAAATPQQAEPASPAQKPNENTDVASNTNATESPPTVEPAAWRHEASFSLTPGEGAEIKMVMTKGDRARFFWTANGSVVNYDTHGDGGGNSISYEKGRGVPEQEGVLEAAFTGNHGWFWRNRTNDNLTVTLRTSGDYSDIKRLK